LTGYQSTPGRLLTRQLLEKM